MLKRTGVDAFWISCLTLRSDRLQCLLWFLRDGLLWNVKREANPCCARDGVSGDATQSKRPSHATRYVAPHLLTALCWQSHHLSDAYANLTQSWLTPTSFIRWAVRNSYPFATTWSTTIQTPSHETLYENTDQYGFAIGIDTKSILLLCIIS